MKKYTGAIASLPAPRLSRRRFVSVAVASAGGLVSHSGWTQEAARALDDRARAALAELERWAVANKARLSGAIADARTGRVIARSSAELTLNPASNQKLLTTAAALDLLGPEHRFTSVLVGSDGASPTALGELALRSDGDPELSSADLTALVEQLQAAEYRSIEGDVLVDQSAFDDRWEPPGYEQRPKDWAAYRAPVSAVAVDRNAITLHVAAATAGEPARTWFEPAGVVTFTGSVRTGAPGSRQDVRLTVGPNASRMAAQLGGTIPEGKGILTFARRLADPELAGGHVLRAKLQTLGVAVQGRVASGGRTLRRVVALRRSRPLAQIVHALGKASDNFTAEMLLKAMGAKLTGSAGTSAAGLAAIERYLQRHRAMGVGTRLGNGSGLYDANRVSAETLTQVLVAAYADSRVGPELVASLAIGGVDGTLTHRLGALRAGRRVRAKTGTLATATALSGYVLLDAPLNPIAFSLLLNDVGGKQAEAKRGMDRVVEAIARGAR